MYKKWFALIGTGLAGVIVAVDFTIVNTSLAPIQKELHASMVQLQWLMSGFGLFFVGFLITTGRLADLQGRRLWLYLGIAGFALASLGAGLAQSPHFLIAMRMLQGLCCASIFPCGMAITANAFPEAQRNTALGIYNSLIGFGLAFGPVLGGLIVTVAGWRWIFFINLPIVLIGFLCCLFSVEESKQRDAPQVDWPGVAAMVLCIGALLVAVNESTITGWLSVTVIMMLTVSAVSLVAFIDIERRTTSPILPLHLLKNRGFLLGMPVFIAGVSLPWSILFLMPLYLHDAVGLDAARVGLTLFVMTVMTMIAPAIAGHFYGKRGEKPAVHAVFILGAAGMIAFNLLQAHGPMWLIIAGFILFGAAWGASNGIAVPLGLSRLPDVENGGLVAGSMLTLMNLTAIVLLSVSTALFEHGNRISFMYGLHTAFILPLAVLLLLWLAAAATLHRRQNTKVKI